MSGGLRGFSRDRVSQRFVEQNFVVYSRDSVRRRWSRLFPSTGLNSVHGDIRDEEGLGDDDLFSWLCASSTFTRSLMFRFRLGSCSTAVVAIDCEDLGVDEHGKSGSPWYLPHLRELCSS